MAIVVPAPPDGERLAARLVELPLTDARWRALVAETATLPFHLPEWAELVGDCYGFRAFGLGLAESDGSLVAGLPVVEASLPFGRRRRWVSQPYTDYCPPLAPGDEEAARLVDAVDAAARFKKKQVTQRIGKAEKDGVLSIRRAGSPEDLTRVYYGLHAGTRKRLGVPVQPRRFFELIWERLIEPGHGSVYLAYADGEAVAGGVFLVGGGTVVYKFGASERSWQKVAPNNLLLWHAIRDACEEGHTAFDFGRTDPWNEGLRHFKLGWGTIEEELRYARLPAGEPEPAHEPGAASRAVAAVIQRSPTAVARAAGALLYRYAA
jgi:CelD/BcsL family acetyltransferase involved in cellulose biosynthesis